MGTGVDGDFDVEAEAAGAAFGFLYVSLSPATGRFSAVLP